MDHTLKNSIDNTQIEKWKIEIQKDNPILISKLNKLPLDSISPEVLLTEVLKFLSLVSIYQTVLTPSLLVDLAWHEFILFTKSYHHFCTTKLGKFIHHTPDDNKVSNNRNYLKTLQYYIHTFGKPSTKIWGKEAENEWNDSQCGSCFSN